MSCLLLLEKGKIKLRKNHNSKYFFLQIWEKHLVKRDQTSLICMYLSKAFSIISQRLLLGKLGVCVFSITSLKVIQNYLYHRFQRTKAKQIILDPFLLNIFSSNFFHSSLTAIYATTLVVLNSHLKTQCKKVGQKFRNLPYFRSKVSTDQFIGKITL